MRRMVPFTGEEKIERAKDEQAQAKKAQGNLIDDVLSNYRQPSSWDDYVPIYSDPTDIARKAMRPHAATAKPSRTGAVPFSSGPTLKKAIIDSNNTLASGSTAALDWLPINGGHALRINVSGNLDQGLRNEWRRLLDETQGNGIGQFEFNLTQSPSLSLTGLGMLLLFKEQKGSARGDIKLCHCNKEVWQLLQWTGMDKYFTIQGGPE